MNCDQANELLMDLIYGELSDEEARAVERHAADCPKCAEELQELRLGRLLIATHRGAEPADVALQPPRPARLRLRRFIASVSAAAAAIVIGVTVWMFHESTIPEVYGQDGSPVITQTGVSLTIMSRPDNYRGARRVERDRFRRGLSQRGLGPGDTLMSRGVWPGMALVRDQRLVRRLKKGVSEISFTGVPFAILPDTIRLRGIDHPEGLAILEQNYQYDLASASAVLKRYVDKAITIIPKDGGKPVAGVLMSFNAATLVVRMADGEVRNIERAHVRSIAFAKLPTGLLTRPTLVWGLENRAAARQRFEVAYLTHGLNWRADYVLKLKPAVIAENEKAKSGIVDTADLVGYATITNNSGVTYENAQLKLMAGDVNLIPPETLVEFDSYSFSGFKLDGEKLGKLGFKEKSFFEYHLYTLGRATTIADAETKQIELLSGGGIKLNRGYVYDRRANATAARVVSEFKNSKENGLGKPLPKGAVRLYAPDGEGVDSYVARVDIDHTPVNEKVRLMWGHAFDIVCSSKQTKFSRRGPDRHETWEYQIRNHKEYDVTVTIIAHVPRSTYKADCNYPWRVRQVGMVEIDAPIKANTAVTATFSYSYNNVSGGGLTSPHGDKDND
ncbi:MAG: zf-HC2 domain-containing protein [Phycisphaerae bacterium]|jgi:hypothetical protein|nr:zf-HC2 domain-containing protein [Phycisphaerae bacterium]